MCRLKKKEWELFDKLLAKVGFGGYYDCIEVLRMTAINLCKTKISTLDKRNTMIEEIEKEDNFKKLILLIRYLSRLKPQSL